MEYRRIGQAGIKVSAVSLGGWLTYGGSVENDIAKECIRTAIENGINFIDVADAYANGGAELVLGEAVKDMQRSDLVVSTKVYFPMSDNPNDRGLSRKHVIESVHKSLKRLQMDYVDMVFCHRYDEESPTEETVRAFEDLIRQGKVLYWGTSMWPAAHLNDAINIAERINGYAPIVEQPIYNMLNRGVVEGNLDLVAQSHGVGFTVFSPLAQGLLTGKYNDGIPEGSRAATTDWLSKSLTEANIEKARQLTALAQEMGTTPAALALAWAIRNPYVASVITGASRPEQVLENIKAMDVTITDEIETRIEGILDNRPQNSLR